jgi:hypothetical protein
MEDTSKASKMWREKLRRHKDRHRRYDARKSSNDYVSRERDGVETSDACLADTEEPSKQGNTGLKQEDLDNFVSFVILTKRGPILTDC